MKHFRNSKIKVKVSKTILFIIFTMVKIKLHLNSLDFNLSISIETFKETENYFKCSFLKFLILEFFFTDCKKKEK